MRGWLEVGSPGSSLAPFSRKRHLEKEEAVGQFANDSQFLGTEWKGLGGEEGLGSGLGLGNT